MSFTGPGYPATDAAFARAVKSAREMAGLTQDDVAAQMAGRGFPFHQATVYKVETGSRKVSIAEATALSSILGVPLIWMVDDVADWRMAMVNEARELIRASAKMMAALSHVQASQSDLAHHIRLAETVAPGQPMRDGIAPRAYFAPLLRWSELEPVRKTWQKMLEDPAFLDIAEEIGISVPELARRLLDLEADRTAADED